MAKQGQTVAQANRAIRQESLREQLSAQGHVQQVIKNINKIECLDVDDSAFNNSVTKLKVANEQRLKLINKYLPDLKATELTGEGGDAIELDHFVEIVIVDPSED